MEHTKENRYGRSSGSPGTSCQTAEKSALCFRRSESTAVIGSECKWAGDDTRIGCDCPKQLTWFREGKLHRVAADTCDGEVAEKKARELMNGFEAAAKGEPTPIPAGALTTLLDDAVKTFLDTKAASGVTEKHTAKLKFQLEHFSQFALGKGLSWLSVAVPLATGKVPSSVLTNAPTLKGRSEPR